MVVGENYLNIDMTARGLYRVVSLDGTEKSGLFEYADIHALCYAICVRGDCLYDEFDNILDGVSPTDTIWLSFSDGYYRANPTDYVPEWYEIRIGTVKEVNRWLEVVC